MVFTGENTNSRFYSGQAESDKYHAILHLAVFVQANLHCVLLYTGTVHVPYNVHEHVTAYPLANYDLKFKDNTIVATVFFTGNSTIYKKGNFYTRNVPPHNATTTNIPNP